MRLKHIIYILICGLLYFGAAESFRAYAEPAAKSASAKSKKSSKSSKSSKNSKSSKSRTSSKSRKSTSRKSGKKSASKKSRYSKSKTSSRSKKKSSSRSKSRRGRNAVKTKYTAPPKETPQNDSLTLAVNSALIERIPSHLNPGGLRVNSVRPNHSSRLANVSLNENFTYLPVTKGLIDTLQNDVRAVLPDSLSDYRVLLTVGGKSLSYYITKVDKLPPEHRKNPAFVTEVNPVSSTAKGIDNDIVALWHSHGRYYKNGGWQWQRPLLFQTVEDTYTMSYILPYVVPMLENAGAYVFLPRERDTNPNEVIVDNDTNPDGKVYSQSTYRENNGAQQWATGEQEGFIYDLPDFRDTENPFENGTYRQVPTVAGGNTSAAAWYADIPEDGEYAVYVSYKTLPNSTTDAHYSVNYSGGTKEFRVNQKMGGGTWIYLCTVPLEKGYSDTEAIVTLTNDTKGAPGTILTADAVKIGGGMGNIARSPRRSDVYYDPSTPETADDEEGDDEEDEEEDDEESETSDGTTENTENSESPDSPDTEIAPAKSADTPRGAAPTFRTSGYPRFLEGARYWLHWAGFPEYVYSPYHGADDYKDDYTSRGHWVNYLAGGSRVLPGREGLNLPVDLAFALHSDAGKRADDSFVGTLGIYFTQNGASYTDGTPRINSRMLTDLVMQQISKDVRREWDSRWTRRSMWDKSYVEARVPEVPTTLIELMSHQNFADMQYGLDPEFRFTVGRAIYKGIARFLAQRKDRQLVIQPLPVRDFNIKRTKKNLYRLSWKPTPDELEPTAMPTKYVIMERSGDDLGFHKIGETKATHFDLRVADHDIHSFYIIAANEGGAAFPSETLALREAPDASQPVLVVNGFDRVSAPAWFSENGRAGFDSENDFGVPYVKDISFTGYQSEFRRNAGESFGRSGSNYVTQVIAGNTFDYPATHGAAIAHAGRGFVSTSASSVQNGDVKLQDYPMVDVILGKQKSTVTGHSSKGVRYKVIPGELQKKLRQYSDKGGRLMLSGEFISSDLQGRRSDLNDREFLEEVLGLQATPDSVQHATMPAASSQSGRLRDSRGNSINYSSTLNEHMYIVENPDILTPADDDTETLLTFSNGGVAGLRHDRGRGRVFVFSVPFEAITDAAARDRIMKQVIDSIKK